MAPYRMYRSGQTDKATELLLDMANCIIKQDYFLRDPFWQNSASNLLAGLILILFECAQENEINFKSLRALKTEAFKTADSGGNRSDNNAPFIRENFLKHLSASTFANSLLSGTVNVCDTTRGCILSEFDQAMRPFLSQDNLIDLLSGNDLDLSEIGKEKTAVFLIIPDENTIYHFLISVFIKQCYTQLIAEAQKRPDKALYRRVNFLLDEFASLPPIEDFPSMITASRSRGIRFFLIVQSLKQLEAKYGRYTEAIKSNCENWIILHSREQELIAEIVSLCGKNADSEPLVSMSLLQTLNKNKGEAFVLHKRMRPFIANLPDINRYHDFTPGENEPCYPNNTKKAENVFDFNYFCSSKSNFFISKLFLGNTLDEINEICGKDEEMTYEPIFTSSIPQEPEPPDPLFENLDTFPIKIPSDSALEEIAANQEVKHASSLLEKIKELTEIILKRRKEI